MEKSKPWYTSKTIWAGVATVALSAWGSAAGQFDAVPQIPEFVYAILGALGIGGRVAADSKVTGGK